MSLGFELVIEDGFLVDLVSVDVGLDGVVGGDVEEGRLWRGGGGVRGDGW